MNKREQLINELRNALVEYKSQGGDLDVKKKDLPKKIINLLNLILRYDRALGNKTDINQIIEEVGFTRNPTSYPITIDRIKKEIDDYVANGGSIYDPKRGLPYYELLSGYRRRTGLSSKEIYRQCGYDYDETLAKIRHLPSEILIDLNEIKDKDGYIDSLYEKEDGRLYLRTMRHRAKLEQVPFSNYLMFMYGVRLKTTMENVNYLEEVEKLLVDYVNKYGKEQLSRQSIEKNEPTLATKLRHLAAYFPEGTITYHELLNYFGYSASTTRVFELGNNEENFLKELLKLYPDREIGPKFYENPLYFRAIDYAVKNDETLQQYFRGKGFKYDDGYDVFSVARLSKMTFEIENDDIYNEIIEFRKILLDKYDYDLIKDEMVKNEVLHKIFNECKEKFNDKVILKPKL